jgi:hypothetical protein
MRTEKKSLNCALRSVVIYLAIISAFSFSVKSIAAEKETASTQGESGLSKHPWQYGVFVQGGFPPDYRIITVQQPNFKVYLNAELQLYSAGFEAGKQTRRFEGPMPLRGRGEAMLEVMPFWLARYPSQSIAQFVANEGPTPVTVPYQWNGDDFHGASVTPFLAALELQPARFRASCSMGHNLAAGCSGQTTNSPYISISKLINLRVAPVSSTSRRRWGLESTSSTSPNTASTSP